MLNLSSEIMRRLMYEHREIKKYGDDKACDEEWLKHMVRRDIYIEVLSLVDQFLDQIEWNYIEEVCEGKLILEKNNTKEPDLVFCDNDFCGTSITKVDCPHCDEIFYICQQCGELYVRVYSGKVDSNNVKIYERQ